jgi:hypothetical protein
MPKFMVGQDPRLEIKAGSDSFARTKSDPVFLGMKVVENIIVKMRNHNRHHQGGGRRHPRGGVGYLSLRGAEGYEAMTATLRRLAMTIVGQPQRAKGFEG